VDSTEQYDDKTPFQPITLDCAIPASKAEKDTGKLSAVVAYKICYINNNDSKLTLSLDIGEAIRVNLIIVLPMFKNGN